MWKEEQKVAIFLLLLIIAVCSIVSVRECKAEESPVWGQITFRSIHFDRSKKHNENNRGVGLEYRLSESFGFGGGEYRNSLNAHSTYYGISYHPFVLPWGKARAGVLAGRITGYEKNGEPNFGLVPSVRVKGLPFIRTEYDKTFETNLLVSHLGVALQFYYNF